MNNIELKSTDEIFNAGIKIYSGIKHNNNNIHIDESIVVE